MKNLNCRNCGGAMVLDASGMTAVCHYCGTRYVLNHEDTDYYRSFFAQMGRFLSGSKDEQERRLRADELWKTAQEQTFETVDGKSIEVKYMHKYTDRDAEVYTARRNILFHFKEDGERKAECFRKTVSMLDYPTADTRNLASFFPKISGGFALTDGTMLLALSKDEEEYPLRAFGSLPGRHVAWIISRMENLCCVLEYSGLVHPEISPDTLYINPYTHQASLYGGWWKAGKNNSLSPDGRTILRSAMNLTGLRDTAAVLLGFDSADKVRKRGGVSALMPGASGAAASGEIPGALADFIRGVPKDNAFDDFALWDEMLIRAYGERKFVTMETDDVKIYGQ